ncbi:hypothetical protein INT48_000678 [Thamnidium elegans]|uniref:Sugar phosphate transporter domain-containing protein n=1 Tax=Thamnidium elegans TaxID=101142 RepID=A0A8H7SX73_9FUNG|nr:hypothetical protein INT48_000678 [Thamnidium elegans]
MTIDAEPSSVRTFGTHNTLPPPISTRKKNPHNRTQSISTQPVTQKKKHGRRGSLPIRVHELHSPLSPQPPLLPGTISIQIANPQSNVPCGIAAAVEICCSNASLVYITLSFYTMVKSSTPIWVLLFSFLFGFEKPKFLLVAIIGVMVMGVVLTVEGETKYDTMGFTLVLIASIVSGLRWSMTQLLLKHENMGISNPIATLYYLSPIMFVTMLTLSLVFERPFEQFQHSKHFDSGLHILESFGLMSIGGFLAFAMTLAELYLIKSTSTITLSVAGISKEIVVIVLAVLIYEPEKGQYQMIPLHSSNATSPTQRNLRD